MTNISSDPDSVVENPQDLPSRPSRGGRNWRSIALIAVAIIGFAAAAYLVALIYVGDDIPRGTTVAGVDLGGMTADEATQTLTTDLAERSSSVDLLVGDNPTTIKASRAGLSFDAAATVDTIPMRDWSPITLVGQLFGQSIDPVVAVEDKRLDHSIAGLAKTVDDPVRDGAVRYDGMDIVTIEPRSGLALNQPTARAAVIDGYLVATDPIELPVEEVEPQVTAEQVADVASGEAVTAISAPITLTADEQQFELSPEQIASVLTFEAKNGELVPTARAQTMRTVMGSGLDDIGTPARDATFDVSSGKPVVVPAKTGRGISDKSLNQGLAAALTDPERTAELRIETVHADLSTAEAKDLGVKRRISTYTQWFPYAAYRVTNIGLASQKINGTLLMPGDTFSLNGIVGERTPENGFVKGYVIVGNRLVEDYGGAVSTMTTAMWHAAFFAGMTRVEQRAHGYWISRYTPGLEATVSWGNLDLKFRNDTPYGVYISTSLTNGDVTVSMYSTKYWDITAEFGPRTNYRPSGTVYDPGEGCVPQEGVDGFDITVTRVWSQDGKVVRREPLNTSYTSAPTVICEPKPTPTHSGKPTGKPTDKPTSSPSHSPSPSPSGSGGGGGGGGGGGNG